MPSTASDPTLLQLLGPVYLRRPDGSPLPRPLTQPRPLAVLAYLALARPRGLHSRDTLLALLWPESTQASGRHALRNALHAIRNALGDDALVTAGDGLVGLDPARVRCDALELEQDLAAGRLTEALRRYEGELLQGFFVAGAPGFERWLDDERHQIRDALRSAAWARAARQLEGGDPAGAATTARRAYSLAPEDEQGLGRLMDVLVAAGDRTAALQLYDEFAARLSEEYGMHPSAETVARARAIRASGPAPTAPGAASRPTPPSRRPPSTADGTPAPQAAFATGNPSAVASPPVVRRPRGPAVAAFLALAVIIGGLMANGRRAPTDTELSDPTARVARQQATALGATLPDRYRTDTAHFRRYFRAEEILDRGYVPEARDSMRRLTEDAPFYAPAWTGYASALSLSGFADIPPRQALPQSLAAVERGLALDSTLLEGAVVLIAYDMFGRWDLDAAKAKLDGALARAPDDPALNNVFAAWYRWRGDLANAVAVKQRAASLQPLSNWLNEQVAWNLYLSHRCAEAAKLYEQLANEGRMMVDADLRIFHTYKCMGRLDDAATALRASLLRMGDSVLARLLDPPLDSARREAAFHAVARARLARYLATRRKRWLPSETAMFDYADLGDADSTLVWLDSMWVERSMHLHIVPFDPALDFLRSDPRFRAFVRRLPWKPSLAAAPGPPR